MQNLLEAIFGDQFPLEFRLQEDNNQVIQAARKGYSPSLKHLNRVERCSLAHLYDCVYGPDKQRGMTLRFHEEARYQIVHFRQVHALDYQSHKLASADREIPSRKQREQE